MTPALANRGMDKLAVRNRELALEHDEFGDEIEHTPSFRQTGIQPAPNVVIGGPSRFRRGMAPAGLSSHRPSPELRKGGKAYTRRQASLSFARSSMRDGIPTSPVVSERAEAAYRGNYKLLAFLAATRFRIPEDEVCGLIHDVFVSFIRSEAKIGRTERDERSWLVGAICNASRYYWRKHPAGEALPEARFDASSIAEEALDRLELARVLRALPERCRDLLCRRYVEGYSSQDIAKHEALTSGSTRNLISKCLLAARAAFSRRRHEP